ncbi:unannotated protein [freshwater metagenome]|uniref:Unannotated protein n=1 Tax=freshwater metagenome TaxID=449393 RepID=A0A6J7IZD7_9ZZZZ
MSLSSIEDEGEARSLGEALEPVDVDWLSVEVYRKDRGRPAGDCGFCGVRLDEERTRIWLDGHWICPDGRDREPGCDEGVGRDEYVITGPDAEGLQCQDQCIEA